MLKVISNIARSIVVIAINQDTLIKSILQKICEATMNPPQIIPPEIIPSIACNIPFDKMVRIKTTTIKIILAIN